MAKHRLRHLEVGDYPIFQRPHGHDITWGTAEHPLGFIANS
jgi:hypothetical protein